MHFSDVIRPLLENQTISTFVLFVAIFLARLATNQYLNSHVSEDPERRRRIASNIKNTLFVILVFGLLFIWAPSLRTFALSLTAFAVAIILATKELILCLSGTFLKTSTGDIKVGDWITVNGIRGEVIDQSIMSTKLQELGDGGSRFDFTGRTITLPNSIFLSAHVINDEMNKKFVYHTMTIVIDKASDPSPVIDAITGAIKSAVQPKIKDALEYKSRIEEKAGISLPGADPVIHFGTTGEGKVKLMVRAMMPTDSATAIEKTAMLAGLEAMRAQAAKEEAEKPKEDNAG